MPDFDAKPPESDNGWGNSCLGDLISEVDVRVKDLPVSQREGLAVLSLTKNDGLVLQSERFNHRVATEDVSKYKVVHPGQLVYNPYVIWEGAVHVLRRPQPGIVSPVYPTWEGTALVSMEFLDYLVRTDLMIGNYQRLSQGAVNRRRSISKDAFKNIEVLIPSLPEQHKIAAVLNLVQRAIEQQEQLIALTIELKKALMHRLFTEGLQGEPQKETELGLIPESWAVVRFGDCVGVASGQVDPRQLPFREMPHVGPENIEADTGRLGQLRSNGELGISSGNYYFDEHDVLYSKIRPYLNKVALPTFQGTCSADMYPIRSEDGIFQREYLFQFMLSETFKRQAMSHQARTGIPKINRTQLATVLLARPSIAEQTEIASLLGICDNQIEFRFRKQSNIANLFRTLLHQLMTAQIRVDTLDLTVLEPLSR